MAAGSSSTKPAAKTRSPVERVIVWGVIGILLVLVGIEFTWRSSHVGAYEACRKKIEATEIGDNTFKHKDVLAIVGSKAPAKVEELHGKNVSNGAKSVEIYTWPTLNPMSKRELYVYYGHGDDPDVIGVGVIEEETTEKKYPPLTEAQLEEAKKNQPMTSPPMMGGPGMGGPPRGHSAQPGEAAEKPADGDKSAVGDKPTDEDKKPDQPAGDEKPEGDAAPADKPADE